MGFTVPELIELTDVGVTMNSLKLLIATEHPQRMIDLMDTTGLERRCIERIIDRHPIWFTRSFKREDNGHLTGAPRTVILERTKQAGRMLNDSSQP